MGREIKKTVPDGDVIRLVDILKVLFRRKWLIIGGVVMTVAAAVTAARILPRKYCAQTVIEVGQIAIPGSGYSDLENPGSLTAKITSAYSQVARADLGIPEEQFPAVTATNPKDTSVVKVTLDAEKSNKGDEILKDINEKVIEDHKALINEYVTNLRGQIRESVLKESEMKRRTDFLNDALKRLAEQEKKTMETFDLKMAKLISQMKTKQDALKLKDEEKRTLTVQLQDTRKRLAELYALKDSAAKGAGGGGDIGLILFANEISSRQRYADGLDMKLNVTLVSEKKWLAQAIENLTNQIDRTRVDRASAVLDFDARKKDLEERIAKEEFDIQGTVLDREKLESLLANVRETRVLMPPSYCDLPVTSARKTGLIAGATAILFFTFLAFFLEFWGKNKEKITRT